MEGVEVLESIYASVFQQVTYCAFITCPMCRMLGAGLLPLVLAAVGALSHIEANSSVPPSFHSRIKRCSCNNWMDKECVYFCHLDIIWVNTGGQTIPYGLGNPRRCKRKALARCVCEDIKDRICDSFCYNESWNTVTKKQKGKEGKLPTNNLQITKRSQVPLLLLLREIAAYKTSIRQSLSTTTSKLPSYSVFWKRKR
ncbi:endothelin-1-like [Aquarana catesbeiana]|uniref:endothelin-1-like n=1 Tax=Aquarana catesbeiana TaxID=8400 RepID=UPI003CCA68D9